MTNLERFRKTINWEKPDRIVTWDVVDNEEVLRKYGRYDRSKKYSFEELVQINITAFKRIGLGMTRYVHDQVNHWMGAKISNWIRFFGVNPYNWIGCVLTLSVY